MFVFNFKVDKNKFLKWFKVAIILLAIMLFVLTIVAIFKKPISDVKAGEERTKNLELDSSNYTQFLKDCHDNMQRYENTNVVATGYVYRLPDFKENQFVLARTMLINSNSQAVVVGMLCECENAKDYKDYEWVSISGIVDKGDYNGSIPEIKVFEIKKSEIPEDEFVYEPID